MDSIWEHLKTTYYLGKIIGLFPFAGRHKFSSLLYSFTLWIVLVVILACVSYLPMVYTKNVMPTHAMVITVRVFFNCVMAVLSVVFAAYRSRRFFHLVHSFQQFDTFILKTRPQLNSEFQFFYLLYGFVAEAYYFSITYYYYSNDLNFIIMLMWTFNALSTMIMMTQYMVFVRDLREKYKLANRIFSSNINRSVDSAHHHMCPREIANLYNELQGLTEEVKNYYAYHAVLTIFETVLILVSNVTALTLNYTNKIQLTLIHNKLFLMYCISKLLFLFFIVRDTHNTVQEARKTVFIAHDALGITTNKTVIKGLEILIMTCRKHPIVFDVFDFFDLDYKLLQSITASVVTYVVVLVQIQLAISNTS